MVEAWCGTEALHASSAWDILALSSNAHIDLASLLGKVCQLHTALADGTRATRSGLINQVALLGSEGGLARYRLHVVDWTWMLSQSIASRVWQDKALLDIIASIFTRYAPQAVWRVSDEVGPFLAQAHQGSVRGYSVQYRQTDLAFCSILLADAGSWRIEEDKDSPAKHRLVIFADSTQKAAFPEDYSSAQTLGGQAVEAQDSIQALVSQRQLPSAVVTLLSTDYKTKQSISASAPTAAPYGGKQAPRLESYQSGAPYGVANREQAQRQAELQQQALEARHQRWFASGTVRTLRAGTRFTLSQGPLPELNDPKHPGFNVLSVKHLGINNLPKPAKDGLAELLGGVLELLQGLLSDLPIKSASSPIETGASSYEINSDIKLDADALLAQAQALGYANQAELIRADLPWRPLLTDETGARLLPTATAMDGGGNQQRIHLKTSQYASELSLGHLIHSADNYRGSLRGQGFELRSDAYGAVRAGSGLLLTSYAVSHSATARDPAGDNSAALALLKQAKTLSEAFSKAAGSHATVKLASHEGSTQSGQSAIDDKAAPLAALYKASATQVSSTSLDAAYTDAPAKQTAPDAARLPHSGEAIVTLAAQGGLSLVARQSLQLSNSETVSLMSGQDSQAITGGQLRIHSGQAIGLLGGATGAGEEGKGLTLIAAQDPIRYEAQSDEIKIQAKGLINIQSASAHIDWAAAKKISLSTAGGANITIEGGNITVQCPGKLTVHAASKKFDGPGQVNYQLPIMPRNVCIECIARRASQRSALVNKGA
jgi:uncharacterized protein involved in type VI secretion and phage assembly/uncharacterized protein (DUF2345 family)